MVIAMSSAASEAIVAQVVWRGPFSPTLVAAGHCHICQGPRGVHCIISGEGAAGLELRDGQVRFGSRIRDRQQKLDHGQALTTTYVVVGGSKYYIASTHVRAHSTNCIFEITRSTENPPRCDCASSRIGVHDAQVPSTTPTPRSAHPRGDTEEKKINSKDKNITTTISLNQCPYNSFEAHGQDYASTLSSRVDHWDGFWGCQYL